MGTAIWLKEHEAMQIKLMVGEREVQLGWEALESLVNNLPDEDESLADLFHNCRNRI